MPRAKLFEENRWLWLVGDRSVLSPATWSVVVVMGLEIKSQKHGVSNNWRPAYGRSQQLRKRVLKALMPLTPARVQEHINGPVTDITFTRCAPRRLDDDNLRTAFKPIRDQVVAWLAGYTTTNARADDGMRSGYTFEYRQQQQRAYGVQIELR